MAIPSWLSLNKTSGDKNSIVDVTASPNNGVSREDVISIKINESLSQSINCIQEEAPKHTIVCKILTYDENDNIITNEITSVDIDNTPYNVPKTIERYKNTEVEFCVFTKNKYDFLGWYNGSTLISSDFRFTHTVTRDIELIAKFKIKTFTITTTTNNATMGTVEPTTQNVAYGKQCTVKAIRKSGYKLKAWGENGNTVSTDYEYTFTVTSSRTLTAVFEAYNLSIPINITPEGAGTTVPSLNIEAKEGQTRQLTATAKTGYHFKHWLINGDVVTTNPYTYTVIENGSVSAVFEKNTYTVTWNPNGGSVSPTSVSKEHGATLGTLPTPTRSNTAQYTYTFKGWFTAASGGTQISASTTVTSNVTYYAQWTTTTNSYTHTFNANGGNTPSQSSITKTYGSTLGTLPTCTKTSTAQYSYSFVGWFDTNASSGGTQATTSTTVTGNKTWYARFSASTRSYTITASPNNSSYGTVTGGGTYNYGINVTLKATAKSGYHFVKWSDGNTNSSRTITVSGSATYTAVFEADPYLNLDKTELTFEASGGTQVVNVSSNVSWSIS